MAAPNNHLNGFKTSKHVSPDVTPAAAFSLRPPSPPHVHIGPYSPSNLTLTPRQQDAFAEEGITKEEFANVFEIKYTATDSQPKWGYSKRREAQMVTPFIYLGPSSAARDRDFIAREGITMLLAVRDTVSAQARLLSGAKVAEELGIQASTIDVAGNAELIKAYPSAVRVINDHLISFHRKTLAESGGRPSDTGKRAKVMIFCESGNDRSVSVVVAYMMTMYGMDLIHAIQFVQSQRFCIALDDSHKNLLKSYHGLLQAQLDCGRGLSIKSSEADSMAAQAPESLSGQNKRCIEDTMDVNMDGEDGDMDVDGEMDGARFEGRSAFAPYIDC